MALLWREACQTFTGDAHILLVRRGCWDNPDCARMGADNGTGSPERAEQRRVDDPAAAARTSDAPRLAMAPGPVLGAQRDALRAARRHRLVVPAGTLAFAQRLRPVPALAARRRLAPDQ